jgi:hypothetical protein
MPLRILDSYYTRNHKMLYLWYNLETARMLLFYKESLIMSSYKAMFKLVVFKDGTVEVNYEYEGEMKTVKLKPKNPAMLLLPILSTLVLSMGSEIILQQQVKKLIHQLRDEE